MNHGQLLSCCVQVLDSSKSDALSLEDHLEAFFNSFNQLEGGDKTFISEVFSGCIRYEKILNVVLDGFYNRDGKRVLRSEENIYRVLCFLALFRLNELGMANYRCFVASQDHNKIYRFFNFFLNDKHLVTWVKDEWCKLYETSFVKEKLLAPILEWLPEFKGMIQHLKDQVDNKVKPKKPNFASTEPKPFSLTQPVARSIPLPEPIPKMQKSKDVPKTVYVQPKEKKIIDQIKETNRRKAEERLMEASKKQFACANPEISDKTKYKLQTIVMEEESKLDFNRPKYHPLPSSVLTDSIPIRLNAATILREGKLYQKKEEEEIKKLEHLEKGSKNKSDFNKWQTKMRQQDLDDQLADIERRRLEGKLSHEDAILARQNLIANNKQKVADMKEEAQHMMHDYLQQRLDQEQEMKMLVETILKGHENAKSAKRKLFEYKQKIVQEMNDESKELMRQALEEAEVEMRQKMELIQQIRAMEAVPLNHFKTVDFTDTAGHGLLGEMSIAELKERLDFLNIANAEKEDEKRDSILADKQNKDQLLLDTLDMISRHRTEHSRAAAIRLEEKKKTHLIKPEVKDEKLLELQRKLESKKQERKKFQQITRIVPDKESAQRTRTLIDSKKAREENRWKELEQRKQNTAKLASRGIVGSQSASRVAMANRVLPTPS